MHHDSAVDDINERARDVVLDRISGLVPILGFISAGCNYVGIVS